MRKRGRFAILQYANRPMTAKRAERDCEADAVLLDVYTQYISYLANTPSSPPLLSGFFQAGLRPIFFTSPRSPK